LFFLKIDIGTCLFHFGNFLNQLLGLNIKTDETGGAFITLKVDFRFIQVFAQFLELVLDKLDGAVGFLRLEINAFFKISLNQSIDDIFASSGSVSE